MPGPAFTESDIEEKGRFDKIMFQKKPRHYSESDAKQHQADYWAQIDLIDENVGRLLSTLEEIGQDKNTVIIFTSDGGEMCTARYVSIYSKNVLTLQSLPSTRVLSE